MIVPIFGFSTDCRLTPVSRYSTSKIPAIKLKCIEEVKKRNKKTSYTGIWKVSVEQEGRTIREE